MYKHFQYFGYDFIEFFCFNNIYRHIIATINWIGTLLKAKHNYLANDKQFDMRHSTDPVHHCKLKRLATMHAIGTMKTPPIRGITLHNGA